MSEQIDLVQEQNDTRAHEPSRINDGVKENQAFHHPILAIEVRFLQENIP